ncbi:Uma2 family endonuclease [Streptomyces sp. NPDC050418]|uniref:Uma2 family endonuclease n=1 Tax=Streptomyces sp. NPDC050418 TaxID=3365612 RepID=UPI00379BE610
MREHTDAYMLVEDFEEIAAHAPETVTLEFIGQRIREKCVADGNHSEVLQWLLRRLLETRPDAYLYSLRGLQVETHGMGRARPDGTLAPDEHFRGHGEWSDPAGILMTVEVTSYDSDSLHSDRVERPEAYAGAGIPVYLLIDRAARDVVVHTNPDPERGRYEDVHTAAFGKEVTLPDPVGITLDTEILKNYVR